MEAKQPPLHPRQFPGEDSNMRTFNARIYSGKDVVEIRENLSASQVCDFAREVSGRGVEKNTSLLIEQLWNGENEQQYLDREIPGAVASGFVFRANHLRADSVEDRCQDFSDVFGCAQ